MLAKVAAAANPNQFGFVFVGGEGGRREDWGGMKSCARYL